MIAEAILRINPNAVFTVRGGDIDTCEIEWLDGNPTNITNQQILDKQAEMQTAEDAAVAKKATDKANAKAKLIAGEALTADEADTIVL